MHDDELDVITALVTIFIVLALIAVGFAFIMSDEPCAADGSNAGANAATVEQIMEGS